MLKSQDFCSFFFLKVKLGFNEVYNT